MPFDFKKSTPASDITLDWFHSKIAIGMPNNTQEKNMMNFFLKCSASNFQLANRHTLQDMNYYFLVLGFGHVT